MNEEAIAERRRQEARLASLFDECYNKLARYTFARLGDRTEAEDLASEVFLRALESLDSYQERGVPMQAWLFKIAHNLVVDHLRKAKKQRTVSLGEAPISDMSNPEEEAEIRLELEKVSRALKQLTPAQQEVIGLRIFGGLSSGEVAEVLGKRSGAVREMQSAAIKALRKLVYEES